MPVEQLRRVVLASLMAALMAVGAYIHVPVGPVPIVLTNLFVLLSGLLIGSRWGLVSVGLYLLIGAIGMPVFYGGKGGIAHILGPTGGYLFGFALSAWGTGFISQRFRHHVVGEGIAVIFGVLAVYGVGVPWLKLVTGMSWEKAWLVGMLPFLVGDAVKAFVAVVLARAVRPMLKRQATQE